MTPEPGHNSGAVDGGHLKAYIERIERIEGEISDLNGDKSSVYQEAKSSGFDPKIMKKIVAERRKDPSQREEEETLLDLYRTAMGEP